MNTKLSVISVILAIILLTATSVQSVKAFEFTYTPWQVDHPDDKPMYIINRERHQAAANGDEVTNSPEFSNKQSGAVNQNAQSSHFCIAWNCYQTTTTTQSVTTDDGPLVYGEDNNIKLKQGTTVRSKTTNDFNVDVDDDAYFSPSSLTIAGTKKSETKEDKTFFIDILLQYNKPYAPLKDDYIRVSVIDDNKVYEKTIDLAAKRIDGTPIHRIDGTPIHTRFTFGNGEVKVNESVQVCVENMLGTSGNVCETVLNHDRYGPEAVTLTIPHS